MIWIPCQLNHINQVHHILNRFLKMLCPRLGGFWVHLPHDSFDSDVQELFGRPLFFPWTFNADMQIFFYSSNWWMASSTVLHSWVAPISPFLEEPPLKVNINLQQAQPPHQLRVQQRAQSCHQNRSVHKRHLGLLLWITCVLQKESDFSQIKLIYFSHLFRFMPCCYFVVIYWLSFPSCY